MKIAAFIAAIIAVSSPIVTCQPAFADDGKEGAAVSEQAEPLHFNWSGAYYGVSLGGRWADMGSALSRVDTGAFDRMSFASTARQWGTHVGYREQFGHVVAGIELSMSAGQNSSTRLSGLVSDRSRSMLLGTTYQAALKLGYAVDHWLVYAKAGLAAGSVHISSNIFSSGVETTYSERNAAGWVVGAGLEYALTEQIFLGAEYNFMSMNPDDRTGVQVPGFADARHDGIKANAHSISARVSYRFQ